MTRNGATRSPSFLRCVFPPILAIAIVVTLLWLLVVRVLERPAGEFMVDMMIALGAISIHLVIDRSIDRIHHCLYDSSELDECSTT